MDESEKTLLENLKNFDSKTLLTKDTYAEIEIEDKCRQVFISDLSGKEKAEVCIQGGGKGEVPLNMLNFFYEIELPDELKKRDVLNIDLLEKDKNRIIYHIIQQLKYFNINIDTNNYLKRGRSHINSSSINNKKPDKNGKMVDITGYLSFQFLFGYLIDCLAIINNELDNRHLSDEDQQLFVLILDIIIYLIDIVKKNKKKYKTAFFNRKLLIVSQIHGILIGFDSLLLNLINNYRYGFNSFPELDFKLTTIVKLIYELIIESKGHCIPLPCLVTFINLITIGGAKNKIKEYKNTSVFHIIEEHFHNLNENELKYFKKNDDMKNLCKKIVFELSNGNIINTLVNQIYYSFLMSCLKSVSLEKKMNALNTISNIVNEFLVNNKFDTSFKKFIENNNIFNIFFEESVHDEIIKRSINLFKCFAKFDFLSDNIIEKIIERQSNDLMKNILFEIVSVLPRQKKDKLFQRLTQGIKLDNKNSIEYITKLTESCLNNSNDKNDNNTQKEKNYYGLNIIFDYIIKDFDIKKQYDEDIINLAVDSISKIAQHNGLDINDIFFFIEKLFHNIKNNNKHNSVIQSIKLIQKLLDIRNKKNINYLIQNLQKLDEKYEIITLIINDLIRYMKLLPGDYTNENCKDKIYEGIYPHNVNIEQRLNIIFYFFKKDLNNYGLNIELKHIGQLYQIFKPKEYKEDQKQFYEIFTRNINNIDNKILEEFLKNYLQNKEQFNIEEVNDNVSLNLIIEIFIKVNENNKVLIYDGRNIRIENGAQIEGFDMLFYLLTQNSDKNVQNKISKLLCDVFLSFKDYNNPNIPDYWKMYFKKINLYLDNLNKTHDKVAFDGIIKLLNRIYSFSCNSHGRIPNKNDYRKYQNNYRNYNFRKADTNKDYKLFAGIHDRIIDMRYKLGFYYDIPVNNVVMIDLKGKSYSLNDDFENFCEVFSHEKYFQNRGFAYVIVDEVPFEISKMKDNPKDLIESNDIIYKILIDNLKTDKNENKQKIWNFISKLPTNYYFENQLKKYGNKEIIQDNDLKEIFDIKDEYLLTYSLKSIYNSLFDKEKKKDKKVNQILINKKEYLNNFIKIYQGDKLIFDTLINISIDKNNCKPIKIECLTAIIDVLNEIEKYIENEKDSNFENIFGNSNLLHSTLKKLTEIITNLLELNYIKYKEYSNQINEDLNDININNNEENQIIYEKIAKLIEHIFNFIEEITRNKMSYLDNLFNNKDIFVQVFVYDYIKTENHESKKKIDDFLSKNYNKKKDYINKYFDIILTIDIFNYLVKNDKEGAYFHVISSIMKNNNDDKKVVLSKTPETTKESKHTKQAKLIIDSILEYIQNECQKKEENIVETMEEKEVRVYNRNKENFKEGIILFLVNIINWNPQELVKYIMSKVDIIDFFLNKCILRKCIERPLEEKEPFCRTIQTQNAIYKLLIIIFQNIQVNDLYLKSIDYLNKFHRFGFWKTHNVRNWELESKEQQKGKFVGLKNMTSTCYLNSIIQQLFMIPMLRETILKINNSSKNNVLYELQLLFSALKIYEFAYYDPRSFVEINKLNFYEQMDAEEFYGTLIDKIENDIKKLYIKTSSDPTPTPKDSKIENYKYKDVFNYFFGIKVVDELKFVDCGHKRYNEFFYNSIQLEIKEFNNINESLKNYSKTEIMDGDNKINCEQCKVKRTCHKHLIFKSLPNILVIALKRFEFDYNTMLKYKLNKYFEFPYELDMKDYLIENHKETNTEYELRGITIHFGVVDFGHYYNIIKGPDNKWYKFNDISVSEFKEEDIPREAFGDKDIFEEDSYKEKERGKNNAYILIYKKKIFESVDKKIKSDFAFPPYDKYSNINDDIKNEINFKLLQTWTIKTIVCPVYQNFVMKLILVDLSKNIDSNVKKKHNQLIGLLENEGYIIENNNNVSKSNKIFEFCLTYYFNIILRASRRVQDKFTSYNYFVIFRDIINTYIEIDVNKAIYILEEFSNIKAIEEYLVYCPNNESAKDCFEIIINAFNLVCKRTNSNDSITYEFMNTILAYIDKNIRHISLEVVNELFVRILKNIGEKALNYLQRRNFKNWIISFYGNNKPLKNFINEQTFPTLHSDHSILTDQTYMTENDIKETNEESDMNDQQFIHKLNNPDVNSNLITYLSNNFNI